MERKTEGCVRTLTAAVTSPIAEGIG